MKVSVSLKVPAARCPKTRLSPEAHAAGARAGPRARWRTTPRGGAAGRARTTLPRRVLRAKDDGLPVHDVALRGRAANPRRRLFLRATARAWPRGARVSTSQTQTPHDQQAARTPEQQAPRTCSRLKSRISRLRALVLMVMAASPARLSTRRPGSGGARRDARATCHVIIRRARGGNDFFFLAVSKTSGAGQGLTGAGCERVVNATQVVALHELNSSQKRCGCSNDRNATRHRQDSAHGAGSAGDRPDPRMQGERSRLRKLERVRASQCDEHKMQHRPAPARRRTRTPTAPGQCPAARAEHDPAPGATKPA